MELENKNPVEIAMNAIREARAKGNDVVIVDTAGRLAVDEEMMNEIANVHKAIQPQETLFVVDAMTGQDAVNTAKAFNDRLNFDGVILTKLDGDTRGGAAISIKSVVNKPIKFIGTGEKMDAIDIFYPNRMAERILGMGDVVSLVERAQEQFGFLMNAFKYGAPPHGGLAYGLDRFVSLFAGLDSIRDCIAFPKNNSGRDVMLDAPGVLDPAQLDELNLIVDIKK